MGAGDRNAKTLKVALIVWVWCALCVGGLIAISALKA